MITWVPIEEVDKHGKWVTLSRDGVIVTLRTSLKEEVGIGKQVQVSYQMHYHNAGESGYFSPGPNEEISNHQFLEEMVEGTKANGFTVIEPSEQVFEQIVTPKRGPKKTKYVRRMALPLVRGGYH